MALGDGLINFLPQGTFALFNQGNAPVTLIGTLANVPVLGFGPRKLALFYSDVLSSGPHIWYFTGVMPRHYGGNGILVSFLVGFQNVAAYSNPFSIITSVGFQRLDSLDSAVNVDIPSWSTQTSSTIGLTSVTEMQCQQLSFYVPNTAINSIATKDLFNMYFTFENAANTFTLNAYVFNISLTEWT